MAGLPVFITEQRVQPAVGLAAVAKIVDQLGVAVLDADVVEIHRHRVVARQAAEEALRQPCSPSGSNTSSRTGRSAWLSAIGVGCTMLRKRVARQDREGQQIAAAQCRRQRRDGGIGPQVGALDIDMRDARALGARSLHSAGAPHAGRRAARSAPASAHRAAAPPRPARRWRTAPTRAVQRAPGAPRPCDPAPARPGRDRHRVAVLHPQHHAFVVARRGQAGVAIGRPGVGVVRAGQAGAVVGRVGVQRVFHHVMAGGADRVDEQLAGERRPGRSARAPSRLSIENPAGPVGSSCSQVASTRAVRRRTGAATGGPRRAP